MAWPPSTHLDVQNSMVVVVGTPASPITNAATARPSGAVVVYWLCANGVTPTNASGADLIWNAP